MPQEIEQWQSWCNRCQKPTLHQRHITYPNHVIHLLLFLFCCGLWLPVWMLITVVSAFERKPPFLCTICGQPAGELTIEQVSELNHERAIQRIERRARNAAAMRKLGGATAQGMSSVAATSDSFLRALPGLLSQTYFLASRQLKELPGRTDNVLKMIIGEENDILLWFWRIAVISCFVGLFAFVIFSLFRMFFWMFT